MPRLIPIVVVPSPFVPAPESSVLEGQVLAPISCRRLSRYVPYKGTFVLYDGTHGAPDQGQMLEVCESQTTESALKK